MKALTLWRPWDLAITRMGKNIENRTWTPPRSIVGTRIALHAGQRFDDDSADRIAEIAWGACHGGSVDWSASIAGAVFATAIVGEPVRESDSPWFTGPVAWPLMDLRLIVDPPICKGAQGLWELPAEITASIDRGRQRAAEAEPKLEDEHDDD